MNKARIFFSTFSILMWIGLTANANINDVLLTTGQIAALQRINDKISDTLTTDERFDELIKLAEKRKFRSVRSLNPNDLYDLSTFYRKSVCDHIKPEDLEKFNAALDQKSMEFISSKGNSFDEVAADNNNIDVNLLKDNIRNFVRIVLQKKAELEEWNTIFITFYDFSHFDKYAMEVVQGRNNYSGDELWDSWMNFIIANSDKKLF